jgi:hypothetical protein
VSLAERLNWDATLQGAQIRSPKILVPDEFVSEAKDSILLQRTLEEMRKTVKNV